MTADDFRLAVLNPGGRDPEQDFREATHEPDSQHAPVNFHAYAACTRGSFHRDVTAALRKETPVLVLIRGDFRESLRAVRALKKHGRTVAVTLKETGAHQIAAQLGDVRKLSLFRQIVQEADGCIASTLPAAEVYRAFRLGKETDTVAFIPTPYPLHDSVWDFGQPVERRAGIFIGTREFEVPSRNHFTALTIARSLCVSTGERVTVFNSDGRRGAKLLAALDFPAGKLCVIEKRLPYRDYLRELATHKIVFQLDASNVPGQVAGDALLGRVPCVGGDGAIERLAFPALTSFGRDSSEVMELARVLLSDAVACDEAIASSQAVAGEKLSFAAIQERLRLFFAAL